MSKLKKKHQSHGVALARANFANIEGVTRYQYPFKNKKRRERTRRAAYTLLKGSLNFEELCKASDYLEQKVSPDKQQPIFGNPLPSSYRDLGVSEITNPSESFVNEVNWNLISIRKYSYQINIFLVYKEIFEKNFITGNYTEAEKYLQKIEEEVCFSLWTLENRFLLNEFAQSVGENKEVLSNFNDDNKSTHYVKSLAHYLSLRAERGLSVNRYISDLNSSLNKIQGSARDAHIEYYQFQLSFLNQGNFERYTHILSYHSSLSVIDRYLNLRQVLLSILATKNTTELEIKAAQQFSQIKVQYLARKINDTILSRALIYHDIEYWESFEPHIDESVARIFDQYTAGQYSEVEQNIRLILPIHATSFDLYILYARSLVYQRKIFSPIGLTKSVQNGILQELYNLISVATNPTECINSLLRVSNNISSCILGYGITAFTHQGNQTKINREVLGCLSFDISNPILNEIYDNKEEQIRYLKRIRDLRPHSLAANFTLGKVQDITLLSKFKERIPESKFKTELAKSLQTQEKYQEAADVWSSLASNYVDIAPVHEVAIRNLFICYENLALYNECVTLYVEAHLGNSFIVDKIDVKSLLLTIKKNRFKIVTANIDLPIFYTMCDADENETHTAYERFNLSLKCFKPTDLIDKFREFPEQKIIFYLKHTCSSEIIKHSIHITGSKQRLEERLAVCQFLREIDLEDRLFYDDEIKYISNILVIQKGLIELDESKIYVNEHGILTNELKEFEAVYQRFKSISKIAEKGRFSVLDKRGRLTTINYLEDDVEPTELEYSSNPLYDIYSELFETIKEKFLYSKFGIVAYLSTRIRHGVLLGEIRPVFEKHKLITLREGDTVDYRRNYHWDNVYRFESSSIRDKMQSILKEFSSSVDGLIFDLIVKYLQVFNEETNPDGWFNYDFDEHLLFWHSFRALKTRDFNHFTQEVFEILWQRTDENLSKIRTNIEIRTAHQFNDLFDKLERDISDLLGASRSQDIVSSIKSCSTETQTVINRVSRWFKRSGVTASDFHLSDLIDIVMEYTNKIHPFRKIHLEKNVSYTDKLKGEYLTHFADLMRIFTENIIKHADDSANLIPCRISAHERVETRHLSIEIENDITNFESLEALRNVWCGNDIDIKKLLGEKKSGYHKAYKILESDLKNVENRLITEIRDDDTRFAVSMVISLKDLTA